MTTVRVQPAPGMRFRDPETNEPIPEDGIEVTLTPFWRRALGRGDVTRCAPPRTSAEPQPESPQAAPARGGAPTPRKAK